MQDCNMKIVHLCLSCFYIDNYSYQENLLPKYHVKMNYDVTVIASSFSFNDQGLGCYLEVPSEKMVEDGYKVIRLAYKKPYNLYRTLRRYENLYKTIEKEAPDIIFSHGISMADNTTILKYIKRNKYVKLYVDNHADYINSARSFVSKNILHKVIWKYYAKMLEPYMIRCWGVTPLRCRFVKEMYNIKSEKVAFLPMGVDDEMIPNEREKVRVMIRKKLGINDNSVLIITGGKVDRRKNIHILIDALNKLDNHNVHLVICGVLSPEMQYLYDAFNDKIHYMGWCTSQQVMDFMVAADIACFPGTHSTLWEQSVGVGLPAIFKYWDEMNHVNVNDNCLFVKGEDVNDLENKIKFMIEPNNYFRIKINAELAASKFRYSTIAKQSICAL